MMSNAGQQRRTFSDAFRTLYALNGVRGMYRGLAVSVVVFFFNEPYSCVLDDRSAY